MGRLVVGLLVLVGLAALIATAGYFTFRRGDIPYETLAAKYESAASRYADLPSGVRMHYRDQGRAAPAQTLLLLHGYSSSLHSWESWVHELGGEYHVVSVDLPGHGLTRAPAGYRANIEAFRDEVEAFADAIGLDRFVIAGNSMGGNVAWEYTLAHPERVDALILVASSGWEEEAAQNERDPLIFRLLRNPIAAPLLRDLDNTRLIRQGLEASFVDQALVDDAMVSRYADLSRAPGHRDILLQLGLGFRDRNYATPERLSAIVAPTLIMQGAADNLVSPADAPKFRDAIAGSELISLDGVGHLPQEEVPAETAAAVQEFLGRHNNDEEAAIAAQ
ncbi:MAG: alpha/beta fold hydrolase [Hyphomonadaceae bacterium]